MSGSKSIGEVTDIEIRSELESRGYLVLSWSIEDCRPVIEGDEACDGLTDEQVENAASRLMEFVPGSLDDVLGARGNTAIDDVWAAKRRHILDTVRSLQTLPDAHADQPDLAPSDDDLLNELRGRGFYLNVWSVADCESVVGSDREGGELTDDQHAEASAMLMDEARGSLGDLLVQRGNDAIEEIWSQEGEAILVAVRASAAPSGRAT
jgi:hypothetical protein